MTNDQKLTAGIFLAIGSPIIGAAAAGLFYWLFGTSVFFILFGGVCCIVALLAGFRVMELT